MRNFALRYGGAVQWLGFFSLILLVWLAVFAMQPSASSVAISRLFGAGTCGDICPSTTGQSTYWAVFSMWGLMSAAMMAPTFVPTLKTYRDLTYTGAASGAGFAALLAAYLAVWLVFSAIAAAAQLILARQGWLSADGAISSRALTSGLLLVAGGYQFTRLKGACLSKCRAPLTFFMQHWAPGVGGAFRMGWRLGLVCLGCCWALMALGFVGGVMNLVWMGGATVLMVVEKLPQLGNVITKPLGAILLAAGVWTGLQAFLM